MTTPNDPHGPRQSDNPLVQLMVSMSGAVAPEHETEPPGADARSVTAGHEPDTFGVKGILLVPAFVAFALVVAYLVVSGVFFNINKSPGMVNDQPQVVELNVDKDGKPRPINERFARVSSTDPKNLKTDDGKTIPGTVVPQPRLEYLKETQNLPGKDDPPYYRSKTPTAEGNSPEYHPEDLRPGRYVGRSGDPVQGQRFLTEYTWADEGKKLARIPIEKAIERAAHDAKWLPVRKDAAPIARTSEDRSKLSNAGRGGAATSPAPTATPAPKKDH